MQTNRFTWNTIILMPVWGLWNWCDMKGVFQVTMRALFVSRGTLRSVNQGINYAFFNKECFGAGFWTLHKYSRKGIFSINLDNSMC